MQAIDKLKGVFPALYTAYDEQGNVSEERTKALVTYLYDKGIRGLYITGSSGECIYLSVDERKQVMRAVMEVAQAKGMTVIAHVGANNTRDSVELASYAKEVGCDAIASIPPIYFALPEEAILDYWSAMMEASSLPFIIYNIPQTTGTNVSSALFLKMLEKEHMAGIKNTSLPVMDLAKFKALGGDRCVVFNGPDEQYAAGRLMGADGGIGGTYGVMPELYLKIEEFVQAGAFAKASQLQQITTELILELLAAGGMFGAAKYMLKLRGMDIGTPRLPLPQLTEENKRQVEKLEKKITAVIKEWT